MNLKRAVAVISAIMMLMLILAACGSGSPSAPGDTPSASGDSGAAGAEAERSKVLHMGVGYRPTTLDPHDFRNYSTVVLAEFPFESLIWSPHDGSGYFPRLAESWEVNESGDEWTFKLRPGTTFHSGNPLTADDVVYTVDRIVNGENLNTRAMYVFSLASAEKIDDLTVKVQFDGPQPDGNASLINMFIIDSKRHQELGDDYFNLQDCSGTGPWVLEEWIDGQHAYFTKNPNYWNKAEYDPYFEEIYLHFLSEPSSAIAAHLSGTIETYAANGGISNDLKALYAGSEDRIELITYESNSHVNMTINFSEDSMFSDDNFRKAFDMSLNRQLLIDTIFGGDGAAMPVGAHHKTVVGYDETLGPPEYNVEKAKELLAASTYDGRPVELIFSNTLQQGEDIGLAVAEMAQEAGINLQANLIDHAVLSTRQQERDYEIYLISGSFMDGRVNSMYQRVLMRDGNHQETYLWSGYDAYAALIDKIMGANGMDPAALEAGAKELNRFKFENKVHTVPLVYRNVTQAQNRGITGINYYADGLLNCSYVDWDPSLAP